MLMMYTVAASSASDVTARRVRANRSLSSLRIRARLRSAVARKTTVRLMTRFRVHPVECGIQFIEAAPAATGSLVRQVRGQCGAVLKVGEVIDIDQGDYRLAMLADGDGAVGLPRFGHEFT